MSNIEPLKVAVTPSNGSNGVPPRFGPVVPNTVPGEWELTQYERQRKPQPLINNANLRVEAMPDDLRSELVCPICLDLLRHTKTTKECLHRFCGDCIVRALRSGNKECPTCRKKLVSKRSLQDDVRIDSIIAKLFPNREESDSSFNLDAGRNPNSRRHDRSGNGIAPPTAHANSVDSPPIKLILHPLDAVDGARENSVLPKHLEDLPPASVVSILQETCSTTKNSKCIVVPAAAYVEHLAEFLKKRDSRLPVSGGVNGVRFELFAVSNNVFKKLSYDDNLENICGVLNFDGESPLNLYYRHASQSL